MNKVELSEKVAVKIGLTKKQVEGVLDTLLDTIIETLKAGGDVTLTGFGQFLVRHRSARMGVNPRKPSEKIHVPAVTVAKFKTGKALKDALKGKTPTPPTI